MRVNRKDNSLNDMLEILDGKFVAAQASSKTEIEAIPRAWDSLDSDELKFVDREIERCIKDRWYFIENYYVIRDERGRLRTLYPFWDHQYIIRDVVQEEWDNKGCCRLIILKPRQAGSTTWNAALMFHATMFVPNTYTMVMAQDDRVSGEIFQRMMDAYHYLPWIMRPETLSKQQGLHVIFQRTDDNRRMTDPGLGSTLMISNAQKATGVAIGRTVRNFLGSETSRWPDSTVWTADIKPSLNAPDMLGIHESTAFGRSGLYWNMWRAAEAGKSIWRALFIPVYKVHKYSLPLAKGERLVLTPDEAALRDAVKKREGYLIQRGFFKWRRAEITECINSTGSDETHKESYPISPKEAFISSGFCAFPKKELDRQDQIHCTEPAEIGEIEFVSLTQPPILRLHPPMPEETLEKPERVNRFWVWERPIPDTEYYVACLPDGETVTTDSGDKPIETVSLSDKLLDADGDFVPISAITRHRHKGPMVHIRLTGYPQDIRMTPEHPVLISGPKKGGVRWVHAGNVKPGEYVRFPARMGIETTWKDLVALWPQVLGKRRNKIIGPEVMGDSRFWWFVGLYLADGWVRRGGKMYDVTIGLNALKESWLADKLEDVIWKLFGRETHRRIENNCLQVKFNSVEMCEFLQMLGEGAHSKKIPWWVNGLPREYRSAVLHGYWDGDGCIVAPKKRNASFIAFTSVSFDLLRGVQRIAASLGYFARLSLLREDGTSVFRGKTCNHSKAWTLTINSFQSGALVREWRAVWTGKSTKYANGVQCLVKDGYGYSAVRSVETKPFDGYVNNFETETHSYCAGILTVHNCDVGGSGEGNDFSDAVVYKLGYGSVPDEQAAEWHGRINASHFAKVVGAMGLWYNEAEIAVEYAKDGITTGNELQWAIDYPNLYRWKRLDRIGNTLTLHTHWITNSNTRDDAINRMSERLLDHTIIIRNRHAIEEMRDFGRYEGETKAGGINNNDDMCLAPGTKIMTIDGYRNVEDVVSGEFVLGHDGNWHPVTATMQRPVSGHLVSIKTWGIPDDVQCTPNHPVWIRRRRWAGSSPAFGISDPVWIPAEDVRNGDFVWVPKRPLDKQHGLTDAELYLLGWVLGDGYVGPDNRIKIVGGLEDVSSLMELEKTLWDFVRRHPTCWLGPKSRKDGKPTKLRTSPPNVTLLPHKKSNCWELIACNKALAEWLRFWVGHPRRKFVNRRIFDSSGVLPFVVGFAEADGSQSARGRRALNLGQKDRRVLLDLQRILWDGGIWATMSPKADKRGYSALWVSAPEMNHLLGSFPGNKFERQSRILSHPIAHQEENGYWVAVKEVKTFPYTGSVYNMSVDGCESYTANGIAVHNCLAHIIAIAAATQSGKRQAMAESHAMGTDVASSAAAGAMPRVPVRYAVYDNYNRQVCEVDSEQEGREVIKACEVKYKLALFNIWRIVPVTVMKANTAWSPIHDQRGAENELFNYGIDPKKITPGVVQDYRSVMGGGRYGAGPNAATNASAPRVGRAAAGPIPDFARTDDGYDGGGGGGSMVGDEDY